MYDEEGNLKRKFIIAIPIIVVWGVVVLLIIANWYRGMEEKKLEKALESNAEIVISDNVLNTEEPTKEIGIEEAVRGYIDTELDMPKYKYMEVDPIVSICVSDENEGDDVISYGMLDSEFLSVNEKYYIVFQEMVLDGDYMGYTLYKNGNTAIILKDNQDVGYKSGESIPLQKCNVTRVQYRGYTIYLSTLGTEGSK